MNNLQLLLADTKKAMRILVKGTVQGLGFRPFIYKLATELHLKGWVSNSADGVIVEVEGPAAVLEIFLKRIREESPPHAVIRTLAHSFCDHAGYSDFKIRPSLSPGEKTAPILPDLAACEDCLQEVFNPKDRRYLYPFTNCTHCGPRFTIMESITYDRARTSMKDFRMCPACENEYLNPLNRRFHAQPNACPGCGPHLELWDSWGKILCLHHDALQKTAAALRGGAIAAVKGLGGFHLMADARNADALRRLRKRKHREEKPFALMVSSLKAAEEICRVSAPEKIFLTSCQSPIVILKRHLTNSGLAEEIAPGNPFYGVMLPYTPLHHILMRELGFAV